MTPPSPPRLIAIHQPNFFPWLGYFDKIHRADCFIFLDNVAYPKSGNSMGSWCNRVKLNVQGQPTWVSASVKREHGVQLIHEVALDHQQPWRSRLLNALQANYRKYPYYQATMEFLEPLIQFETTSLAQFNQHAIQEICRIFRLNTPLLQQSALGSTQASTALLIELVQKAGGTTYLCGGGATGYQDDPLFERAQLRLEYQHYTVVPYGEPDRFMPGLSVIDYLMSCGLTSPFSPSSAPILASAEGNQ